MLYEIAYPFLAAKAASKLALASVKAKMVGGDRPSPPHNWQFRASKTRLRRAELSLLATIAPLKAADIAIGRFERSALPVSQRDLGQLSPSDAVHLASIEKYGIVLRQMGPKHGPRILILHGWFAHGLMMVPLAKALVAAGYRVYLPDLPGDGASSAPNMPFHRKGQILGEAMREHEPFAAVIGHSAGGLTASHALECGLQAERLITISSPVSLASLLAAYLRRTQAPKRLFDVVERAYMRRHGADPAEIGPRGFVQMGCHYLIAQEELDWQVLAQEAQDIAALAPQARLFTTQGWNHHTVLGAQPLHQRILDFLNDCSCNKEAEPC